MTCSKGSYNVQSVEKALEILDVLAEGPSVATLQQLSEKLKISRNKTFRLLATLEGRGLVEKDEFSGVYSLGLSTVEMAHKFIGNASIIKYAHPVMEGLARKHDEAVYMTVLKGDEVLFLDMVDCGQHIKAAPFIGKRFPCFSNAAGKVIRSLESRDLLEKLFKRGRERKKKAELEALESELNAIREKGVAIDSGGLGEGIITVAVAVRDYAGKVIGALTMLGPSFRMMADRIDAEIIPSLQEGAEMLSMKFGYARI